MHVLQGDLDEKKFQEKVCLNLRIEETIKTGKSGQYSNKFRGAGVFVPSSLMRPGMNLSFVVFALPQFPPTLFMPKRALIVPRQINLQAEQWPLRVALFEKSSTQVLLSYKSFINNENGEE